MPFAVAQRRGSPLAAVKPNTVKCVTLVAACCWCLPSALKRYSQPQTHPSFDWEAFKPHSSTKIANQDAVAHILTWGQMLAPLTILLHNFHFSKVVPDVQRQGLQSRDLCWSLGTFPPLTVCGITTDTYIGLRSAIQQWKAGSMSHNKNIVCVIIQQPDHEIYNITQYHNDTNKRIIENSGINPFLAVTKINTEPQREIGLDRNLGTYVLVPT